MGKSKNRFRSRRGSMNVKKLWPWLTVAGIGLLIASQRTNASGAKNDVSPVVKQADLTYIGDPPYDVLPMVADLPTVITPASKGTLSDIELPIERTVVMS